MADNGIENPQGFFVAGFAPIFLALIPVTNFITHENSVVQSLYTTLINWIPGGSAVTPDRMIPALSAFYIFVTFAATGAASGAGQAAARKGGLDPNHSRKFTGSLTGLPLRLYSAHYNLLEMFPGFALAAALAQATAPANQRVVNLLGLHVLLKCFVYYPCYLAGIAPVRSLAHVAATASVVNAAWQVALGAQ